MVGGVWFMGQERSLEAEVGGSVQIQIEADLIRLLLMLSLPMLPWP